MARVIDLDKNRQVDTIRAIQRILRVARKRHGNDVVVIRHEELARITGWSVSSVRRSIKELVEDGHIIRTHITRDERGGVLCAYWVRTDVVFRKASLFRRAKRAIEQVRSVEESRHDAGSDGSSPGGTEASPHRNNDNYNRSRVHSSVKSVDKQALDALLHTARLLGIDDRQRGWLRGAALKYGVTQAWQALQIAVQSGRYRVADLVRVTWGILKRQQHQQREVMVS
mgnify:CR=1 FL=1